MTSWAAWLGSATDLPPRDLQRQQAVGKAVFGGVESMWSSKTTDGIEARGRDDLNGVIGGLFKPGPYKPLMPKGKGLFDPKVLERTMVQGGAFVFDGEQEVFAHLDFSSGDHADLGELVRLATQRADAAD